VRPKSSPWPRFFQKVTVAPSGCWEWQAHRTGEGYGQFDWEGISTRFAHRIAYTVLVGPIPYGLTLDHLCENPPCVNPQHLKPCTIGENVLRSAVSPTAVNARRTYCKRGHPLSGDNLYVRPKNRWLPNGARACKTCNAMHVENFKAANPGYVPPSRRPALMERR
jgi:hypothetical protein